MEPYVWNTLETPIREADSYEIYTQLQRRTLQVR